MDSKKLLTRLAHYELLSKIGQGGMGVVYRARDTRLQRLVAIKVLLAPMADVPGRRARLLREARAAARLNHPAIATIYEVGEAKAEDPEFAGLAGEVIYIAMELVEGEDLGWHIQHGLGSEEALGLGIQIASGLAAAHQAGVIHRDLKPSNVRVTPQGRVKILDFGLAKLPQEELAEETMGHTLTDPGHIVGTVPYMAPEQFQGEELDPRADLFSLGVILHQMLTGKLPFDSTRLVDYVRAVAHKKPESPSKSHPQIPARLGRAVERLLARRPDERYDSAMQVVDELEAIASGRPSLPSTMFYDVSREVLRPLRRRARTMMAAGLALAASVAVLTGFVARPAPPVDCVAVLPFENMTDDPSLDAYYQGIGATLTQRLARVDGIDVVNELDVRRYRNSAESSARISRRLGAGTLVRGYVQGSGERIRAVVRVYEGLPGKAIWETELEGSRTHLLELQDELAERLVSQLPRKVASLQSPPIDGDHVEIAKHPLAPPRPHSGPR